MLSPALLLSAVLSFTAAQDSDLLTASRGAEDLHFNEGRRLPSKARLVSGMDSKLIGSGIGLLAGSYLLSAALGVLDPVFLVPIAGPFIHLARVWLEEGELYEFLRLWGGGVYSACVIVLGSAQLAGAILILAGANIGRPVRVRGVEMVLAPGAGAAPLGASVVGRF